MDCIQGQSSSPLVVTRKEHDEIDIPKSSTRFDENQGYHHHHKGNSAVYIRNLCKRYNNGPPILQNFCMNVKKGIIYTLLGSSGCGKTTVLSCMVGLRKWDSGELQVFGEEPGSKESGIPGKRLGYMPQELALYNLLSIRQAIQFYGKIYNMTSTEIAERSTFLSKLLELPGESKKIGDMSGGQKRRVSLAIALIHSPELLILDEPTVGLDPLLRSKIWNHLYNLVRTVGTTIIITTHYIEEARLSNAIGVMRNGRLLVEDEPLKLLEYYNCDLLEQVVLKLCRKDEGPSAGNPEDNVMFKSSWNGNVVSSEVATDEQQDVTNGVFRMVMESDCHSIIPPHLKPNEMNENVISKGVIDSFKNNELYQSFKRMYGVAMVIFQIFTRYPPILALIIVMPSINASITLWTFGHKIQGLHFGIVNHELANWTRECDLPRHSGSTCDLTALSCKFLNRFKNEDLVILVSYESEEEALNQVHLGGIWGYFTFPKNYSQHNLDFVAAGKYALNESIDGSQIHVHLDYSHYIATLLMIKQMFSSYMEFVNQLATSCKIGGHVQMPLFFRTPVYGNIDNDFTGFAMPAAFIFALMLVVAVITAVLFISDRKEGTLSRSRVAGLGTADVMVGYLVTLGLIIPICQIIVWTCILHFVFQFAIVGSTFLFMSLCLMIGFCGTAMGILFGIICHDEVEATVGGIFVALISAFLGSIFCPKEYMPLFWQYVGAMLPTTLPIFSLRSITNRGMGFTHILVWPGFVAAIIWTVGFVLCSVIVYKKLCK